MGQQADKNKRILQRRLKQNVTKIIQLLMEVWKIPHIGHNLVPFRLSCSLRLLLKLPAANFVCVAVCIALLHKEIIRAKH